MSVPVISCCFLKPDKLINFVLGRVTIWFSCWDKRLWSSLMSSCLFPCLRQKTEHIFAPLFLLFSSEENSLRKFIQTSYIKQIHQNSEYLLDKCYIFFFKLLNLIFLIQSSAVVNNKACKLTHYLMLVVNVPGC